MSQHWSEQGNEAESPGPNWMVVIQSLVFVVLLTQLPELIFTVLNPHLRKGFEVQVSWLFLVVILLLAASLGRFVWRSLKAP
jgi:hypothetical protein